jgi:type II secretory pathway pseudopilin PulG
MLSLTREAGGVKNPEIDTRKGSRGFILAMLLAIMVAGGILLTAALPSMTAEVQRDQEAELIFRGEAIAMAIRTYRAKTGGYPLNLEELAKLRPPVIRKIYKDPMTKEGEWDLITAVQAGASGDKTGLPIVGVKSHCQKDSYKIYQGKTLISDWAFSATGNLLGTPGSDTGPSTKGGAPDAKGGDGTPKGAPDPAATPPKP